jgi:GNAT superfamily N-acetyltransferase
MGITIRVACPDDRDVLIAFVRRIQDAERAMHPSRLPGEEVAEAYFDALVARPAEMLVAEDRGRPVGFVAGWLDEDDDPLQTREWRRHGLISDLFVAADHRGEGVAQLLLGAMADRLRELGAGRLRICAVAPNDSAIAAYRRFGFEPFEITFDKPLG